ncbi:MAG: hypothetical protein A3E37_03265 [Candidatus Andersenbacteria bacterium RIFCSPHIGHO2_12_FULL_46_9]|nr:MAG: hypothetical protein UW94_C0003G0046 [Parcubacteria group bacterium GW2011_GWA2_45_14]OGY33797.1 MAG: hypothetical protein A3B76_02960 [Candidatus Andersenbacteria bacterium RIFCSPHIGHO2_02_FULL_46_16]OGY36232.1 MAG: hypothetical protein A3I08_05280 [Candidatus Andersenbacteria bacterium RIFCSPLOWO2_02_FULL_46_11]OGY36683.1 MAG: hypothetical protein A3E37_03265 [Candidatus Andersenbacteria bacterium RIFCSPHIGHO2_12_FULL_46_9]OGY40089.1 MAG: hypothetical protein A3G57_02855 [Candidatus A
MSHFLVTGGAGFIGTNIVHFLLAKHHQVTVLDNLSTGYLANLAPVMDRLTFIQGDICDLSTVQEAVHNVDFVLHQAAWRAVEKSMDHPIEAHHNNVTGTLNVLMAARDAKVKRVVLASSSAIYGDNGSLSNQETALPRPASPYAVAKLAGEQYATVFYEQFNLPTISLRYFNAYGPFSPADSSYSNVIPIFVDNLLKGTPPTIHWHGQQNKDFIYVSDIARANYLAATLPNLPFGSAYNIGSGHTTSINELLATLQNILHTNLVPLHSPKRPGDVLTAFSDTSKATRELSFSAKVSLRQGLQKFIDWYLSQSEPQPADLIQQSISV